MQAHAAGRAGGIGFVFSDIDPYLGIDLDGCISEDGSVAGWAQNVLNCIGPTYAEISPSGTGIKLWVQDDGTVDKDRKLILDSSKIETFPEIEKKPAFEFYRSRRYFCVTGQILDGHKAEILKPKTPLKAICDEVKSLCREAKSDFAADLADDIYAAVIGAGKDFGFKGSDEELVKHAIAEDHTFAQLYNEGNLQKYNDDHSSADFALLIRLAHRCGPNPARIEGLFAESALARDKWFDRRDYRERSIRKAIAWTPGRSRTTQG